MTQVAEALAEFGEPPELLVKAVASAMSDAKVKNYLRSQGRSLANMALTPVEIWTGVRPKPMVPEPPTDPWVKDILLPIITPLQEGIQQEARSRMGPIVTKLATWAVIGVSTVGVLGFWMGRKSTRRS